MNIHPRQYSHFDGLHFGDTSTFASAFPIEDENRFVQDTLDALPLLVDSAFTIHSSQETFETIHDGGHIPLAPQKTSMAIERLDDIEKRRIIRSRHFVFQALTNGAQLKTAQLRLDRQDGRVDELSLISHGTIDRTPISIELRAVINNPHEDTFEVVTYKNDEESDSLIIGADVAQDFVHALRENQAGYELEPTSIEVGLMNLLEKSKKYSHQQTKTFDIDSEANMVLRVEREQRISNSLANAAVLKTVHLSLEIEETSFSDSIETVRKFGYLKHGKRQHAWLNYLIRSLDGTVSGDERAAMFETVSVQLRNDPSLPFFGLREAVDTVAKLD